MSLIEKLRAIAQTTPLRAALVDAKRSTTFGALLEHVEAIAKQFEVLPEGTSICIEGHPEYLIKAIFALELAGRHGVLKEVRDTNSFSTAEKAKHQPGLTFLSSGTTGEANSSEINFLNLDREVQVRVRPSKLTVLLGYRLLHRAGIGASLHFLLNGNTLILPDSLNGKDLRSACDALSFDAITTTPTLIRNLLSLNLLSPLKRADILHVRLTAEPVDAKLLRDIWREFPNARVRSNYATTECGVIGVMKDEDLRANPYAVARWSSVADRARIASGLIECEVAGVWTNTGDLGEIVDDWLVILGREKRVLNVGGEKVSVLTVERVLKEIEGVKNARVFAIPNPLTGDLVAAEIELADLESTVSIEEIRWICNSKLPPNARPRRFKIVESLSFTPNGKTEVLTRRRDD